MAKLTDVIELVTAEYHTTKGVYPKFDSPHEGYTALLEGVHDLRCEVKAGRAAATEAVQVAALALLYLTDCC